MTDRYAGFLVTLDENMRSDDAEATIAALRQIKGVATVKPVVDSADIQIAQERARLKLTEKIWEALR